jgi:hypothetical protein
MSFQELLKRVESSPEYKKFEKEEPKAILYSAFFVIRQAFGSLVSETEQLDYWLGEDKVATFLIQDDNVLYKLDKIDSKDKKFTTLNTKIKTDVDEISALVLKELEKKKEFEKTQISKIIIVLQKKEEKQIWNVTCILGLKLIKLELDMQGKFLEKKEESLIDFVKIEKGKKPR